MSKPTICIDFDGVIHSYVSGWQGIVPTDPPVAGTAEAIDLLREDYKVTVTSTRCIRKSGKGIVSDYLATHGIYVDAVTAIKLPAICYLDDRGVTFRGNWPEAIEEIKAFKSWVERKEDE